MVWRKDGSQEGPAFYTLCPFQAANGFQILHPYAIGLTWPVWSMSTYDPVYEWSGGDRSLAEVEILASLEVIFGFAG